MSRLAYSKATREWIAQVAKNNGVKEEEVLRYLKKLSSGGKVIYHLRLEKSLSLAVLFLVMW